MKFNVLKNNKGNSFIKMILLILITILVVFLAYQIIYKDMLDTMDDNIRIALTNSTQNQAVETTDKTSKHYFYNQLDETGKLFYLGLEANIENMKSGTYEIDFGIAFDDVLKSENGEQILKTAYQSAWNAFTYDYTDIFYVDVTKLVLSIQKISVLGLSVHKVNLSSGENVNYLNSDIVSYDDLQKKQARIISAKNSIVSKIKNYSDYEKIKYVHNWLIDNLQYDSTYKKDNAYDVYGALVNNRVVCEGYARTFKYLLDELGIENVLVSGTGINSAGDRENHAWNYVKINQRWYAVDVTWDDPIIRGGGTLTEELRYKNFLKGSSTFFANHEEKGYLSEESMKFDFPTLEKINYIN